MPQMDPIILECQYYYNCNYCTTFLFVYVVAFSFIGLFDENVLYSQYVLFFSPSCHINFNFTRLCLFFSKCLNY